MTTPAAPATAEDLRKAQEKAYGTYVAVEPIDIGGSRAFNIGDPVPVGHVEGFSRTYKDEDGNSVTEKIAPVVADYQVAKRTTRAAKAATDTVKG